MTNLPCFSWESLRAGFGFGSGNHYSWCTKLYDTLMKAIIPQELCLSFLLLYSVLPYLVGPLRPTRTAICFRHIGRNTLFVASRPSLTDATQHWLEDIELSFSLYLCVIVLNRVSDPDQDPCFFSTAKSGKGFTV